MAVNRIHNTPTAQRRQIQIEDCLYENLQHTPWQSISVADLCRQVGISRKAYYNYYKDKEACFCAYIDRLIREGLLVTSQNLPHNGHPHGCGHPSAGLLEGPETLLRYSGKEQSDLFSDGPDCPLCSDGGPDHHGTAQYRSAPHGYGYPQLLRCPSDHPAASVAQPWLQYSHGGNGKEIYADHV